LYEAGFKQHHVDGEALALHAHLRAAGHASLLLDAYYRARQAPTLDDILTERGPFDAVIVHLWTSDAYGPRLATIAEDLAVARARHKVPVVGFGPLATSAADELAAHGAIDHVVGLARDTPTIGEPAVAALVADAAAHLTGYAPLTGLTGDDVPYLPDAVMSVSASRGCRSRCTFCAYNADLAGGWSELPMNAAVADIAHLHQLTGATRFAFADTDFGGTAIDCRRRAFTLLDQLRGHHLAGVVRLSINVRSETLTPSTIAVLGEAGVDVMLIGVESFNPTTLHPFTASARTSTTWLGSWPPPTPPASPRLPATSCGTPGKPSKACGWSWLPSTRSAATASRSSWPAAACSSSPAPSPRPRSAAPACSTPHRFTATSASPTPRPPPCTTA